VHCPHCNAPCRYIGEQRGAEKYNRGRKMLLWTCVACGSTLSQLVDKDTPIPSVGTLSSQQQTKTTVISGRSARD